MSLTVCARPQRLGRVASTPVPSDFVPALSLRGYLLTDAGNLDGTPSMTINWGIESGGGSLAASTTDAQHGRVFNQWSLGPMTPGTVQGIVLTSLARRSTRSAVPGRFSRQRPPLRGGATAACRCWTANRYSLS